jgi:hypothetical protein
MDWAIGMNRATGAYCAELLLFLRLLANGLKRRENFVPIFIRLDHRIHFPLMLRTIRVAGLIAEPLRDIPGSEI